MPCSEKKRQANRENAKKSTGPKSRPGKQKVALNALKHGLRSAQVVLPGEDAAAFDGMVAAWMDDWRPPTDARRVLVELAVAHAWRLRRCLKLERDHLVERGHAAVRAHECEAAERARAEVARLAKAPAAALAELLREREGAVAVLGLWEGLAEAATSPDTWSDLHAHHTRLLNLLGHGRDAEADRLGGAVYASWCLVEWNEPSEYAEEDRPADADAAGALAGELSKFIAGQVRDVEQYLATHFEPPEALAARKAMEAALDDSPEGRALLRYEGQHGREFRAALNQLIKLTQTGADLVEDDEEAGNDPPQVVDSIVVETDHSPAPNKATEAEAASPNRVAEASEVPSGSPPAPIKPVDVESFRRAMASFCARNGHPQTPLPRSDR